MKKLFVIFLSLFAGYSFADQAAGKEAFDPMSLLEKITDQQKAEIEKKTKKTKFHFAVILAKRQRRQRRGTHGSAAVASLAVGCESFSWAQVL